MQRDITAKSTTSAAWAGVHSVSGVIVPEKPERPSPAKFRDLFVYRDGILYWRRAGVSRTMGRPAGSTNEDMRIRMCYRKRRYFRHHVVWAMHYDAWPTNHIGHVNGDIGDDRIENLYDRTLGKQGRAIPPRRFGPEWEHPRRVACARKV